MTESRAPGREGEPFLVGDWLVEPLSNRIKRDGFELHLEPRVMELLLFLAENAGRTVLREHLKSRVWPDCYVGENALNSCVSKLRHALGDSDGADNEDAGDSKFIVTVPKAGYRLVASVREVALLGAPAPFHRSRYLPVLIATGVATVVAILGIASTFVFQTEDIQVSGSLLPLTSFRGMEVDPAPSPDGERVAFTWDGPDGKNWDIYVLAVGGGEPLRLTADPGCDHHAAWSPDGRQIAFSRFYEDGLCLILVVPAGGGPETRVAACGGPVIFDMDWSRDGRYLVYTDQESPNEPFRLVSLDLRSGSKRALTSPAAGLRGDIAVETSPDGEKIAFVRNRLQGIGEIWIANVDGTGAGQLTSDGAQIDGLAWNPDGGSLIFSSERRGSPGLWRIPASGGEPVRLAASLDLTGPSVMPDGQRIALERWRNEANIYRIDLRNPETPPTATVISTRWDWHPALSPDGSKIAFASDRSGPSEIWVSESDGTHARMVTSFEVGRVGSPQWSPGGGSIAFEVYDPNGADIWITEVIGGSCDRLTDDPGLNVSPAWSADGQWIYFASDTGGTWQIWRKRVAGDEREQITREGGRTVRLSPRGGVFFTKPDEAGLWTLSLDGRHERRILDEPDANNRENYIVTMDAVYFVRHPGGGSAMLSSYDLDSHEIRDLAPLENLPMRSGFGISPDGRYLYHTRMERLDIDLVMLVVEKGL